MYENIIVFIQSSLSLYKEFYKNMAVIEFSQKIPIKKPRRYKSRLPKPRNKTHVVCTNNEKKVKGKILEKTEYSLTVVLPTGFEITMIRRPRRKLFTCIVGTLEFVSDGWEIS